MKSLYKIIISFSVAIAILISCFTVVITDLEKTIHKQQDTLENMRELIAAKEGEYTRGFTAGYNSGKSTYKRYYADKLDMIKHKFHIFVFLKDYIQFHVHSIKTFLHIRMTKKSRFLEDKLDSCKIIPDEYYRKMQSINFYINTDKKGQRRAIFDTDVKKVNI